MTDTQEVELILILSLVFTGLLLIFALVLVVLAIVKAINKKKIANEIMKQKRDNGIHITKQKF